MVEILSSKKQERLDTLRKQYVDYFADQLKGLHKSVLDVDSLVSAAADKKPINFWEKFDVKNLWSLVVQTLAGKPNTLTSMFKSQKDVEAERDEYKQELDNYLRNNKGFWQALQDQIMYNIALPQDLKKELQEAKNVFIHSEETGDLTKLVSFLKDRDIDDNVGVDIADADFYQDTDEDFEKTVDFSGKQLLEFDEIQSQEYMRNASTGVTWCSKVARLNADNFGITVPRGNAIDAMQAAIIDTQHYVETKQAPSGEVLDEDIVNSLDTRANCADVFVASSGRYGKYGHRCFMFRNNSTGEWYVLDPYREPNRTNKQNPRNFHALAPKPLADYMKHNSVIKINTYESPKAIVNTIEDGDDIS